MNIKQLSVFLENKGGRIAQITEILAAENINILTLSIADTSDFGILRLIVDDPGKAYELLKKEGVMVKMTEVVAIMLDHKPGSLNQVLNILNEENIQIEYMYHYPSLPDAGTTIIILRLANQEKSLEIMHKRGIRVVNYEDAK